MSARDADVVVVGSGCTGAMAAQTLVEAGARVLMLDVGVRDERYRALVPAKTFLSIRRGERGQHRYFLGDRFEGLPRSGVVAGAQLTPPRQHILAGVDDFLPRTSANFVPVESLAYGGLGSGWGLGCNVFSPREVEAVGLSPAVMRSAYALVGRRVGISGQRDDAGPYTCGDLPDLLPPPDLDRNGRTLLQRYGRRRAALRQRGFYLGRPSLALLTEARDGRGATQYRDMDFYEDLDGSAYRPWLTVDALRDRPAFEYRGGQLVLGFREGSDAVEVQTLDTGARVARVVRARRLVLAAGVLSTARIVLRSLGRDGTLPILCNPYSYIACLQLAMLGSGLDARRTSFAQLMLFHDQGGDNADVAQGSLYSYGPLLLYRLVNETALGLADARLVLRGLLPALVILGLFQPEAAADAGRMRLATDRHSPTGDRLLIDYPVSAERRRAIAARERKYRRAMRTLGCVPLRLVSPARGASIHYAGSLPFSTDVRPFTLAPSGRLHGTRRVYVADGSGFRYLPGKGLTLSLMANAHNVGGAVFRDG